MTGTVTYFCPPGGADARPAKADPAKRNARFQQRVFRVCIVTHPSHDTLSIYVFDQVTGSIITVTYKPDNGYTGPDSFTWKVKEYGTTELYVCDPNGTVSLTVQ